MRKIFQGKLYPYQHMSEFEDSFAIICFQIKYGFSNENLRFNFIFIYFVGSSRNIWAYLYSCYYGTVSSFWYFLGVSSSRLIFVVTQLVCYGWYEECGKYWQLLFWLDVPTLRLFMVNYGMGISPTQLNLRCILEIPVT